MEVIVRQFCSTSWRRIRVITSMEVPCPLIALNSLRMVICPGVNKRLSWSAGMLNPDIIWGEVRHFHWTRKHSAPTTPLHGFAALSARVVFMNFTSVRDAENVNSSDSGGSMVDLLLDLKSSWSQAVQTKVKSR